MDRKWFKGIEEEADLKKQMRKLAKEHHPDVGGDPETMAEINVEYDKIKSGAEDQEYPEFDLGDIDPVKLPIGAIIKILLVIILAIFLIKEIIATVRQK